MAAILRKIWTSEIGGDFYWIALCAAETIDNQREDVYIDDGQDHALREKYLADYESEGLIDGSRIRALEAALARKDAALAAVDKKILPTRNYLQALSLTQHDKKIFADELTDARALIAAALKEEGAKR